MELSLFRFVVLNCATFLGRILVKDHRGAVTNSKKMTNESQELLRDPHGTALVIKVITHPNQT